MKSFVHDIIATWRARERRPDWSALYLRPPIAARFWPHVPGVLLHLRRFTCIIQLVVCTAHTRA